MRSLFDIVVLQCPQRTHCSKLTEGYLSSIPFILIGKSAIYGFFNRPFTFNHLLKSWDRLSCEVQYKHFGTVLQMDLNRVKFGLWHNVLPKVIFPFAGDNEWIVLFKAASACSRNCENLQCHIYSNLNLEGHNIIFLFHFTLDLGDHTAIE